MQTNHVQAVVIAGFEGNIEAVDAALKSPDTAVRCAALGAALRTERLSAAQLKPYFDDASSTVRYRALELCPRLSDGQTLADDVVSLLGQPDLAEVAAFTLGELGVTNDEILETLSQQALHHDDPLCRESAVAALGALGIGRETVLHATGDIATVRRRAVLSLAAFEGTEVDQALQKALTDRDWQVRQAAEDLLATPSDDKPES